MSCGCGCRGRGDCRRGPNDGTYGIFDGIYGVGAIGTGTEALYDLDKQRKHTARAAALLAGWAPKHLVIGRPKFSPLDHTSRSGEPDGVGYFLSFPGGDANTRFMVNRKARELAFLHGTRAGFSAGGDGRFFIVFSNVPERYAAHTLDPAPVPSIPAAPPTADTSGLVAIGSIFTKIGDAFKRKPEGIQREIAKLERRIAALKGRLAEMEKQDEADEAAGFEAAYVGAFPEDNQYFVSVLKMADEAQDFALKGDLDTADELVGALEADLDEVGRMRRRSRRRKPLRRKSNTRRRRLMGAAAAASLMGGRRRSRGGGSPADSGAGGGSDSGSGGGDAGGSGDGGGDYGSDDGGGSYEESTTIEETYLTDVYDPEEEEIEGLAASAGLPGGAIPARRIWLLSPGAFERALTDPTIRSRII